MKKKNNKINRWDLMECDSSDEMFYKLGYKKKTTSFGDKNKIMYVKYAKEIKIKTPSMFGYSERTCEKGVKFNVKEQTVCLDENITLDSALFYAIQKKANELFKEWF